MDYKGYTIVDKIGLTRLDTTPGKIINYEDRDTITEYINNQIVTTDVSDSFDQVYGLEYNKSCNSYYIKFIALSLERLIELINKKQ